MLVSLIAALLLAPEVPVQVASVQNVPADGAVAASPADEAAPPVPASEKICRRSSVQRNGLITQSRKVCRTAAEWKAAAAR